MAVPNCALNSWGVLANRFLLPQQAPTAARNPRASAEIVEFLSETTLIYVPQLHVPAWNDVDY